MIPVLILVLLLVVVTCACAQTVPAPVAPAATPSRWQGVAAVAPNDGPPFGGGLSYNFATDWWADALLKRKLNGTTEAVGVSTDLTDAIATIGSLFGVKTPTVPHGWAIGVAAATDGSKAIYAAKHFSVGF
jgi:hypothetical protein